MGNPIVNFGDYNIAREALKACGGSWNVLFKSIGETAVAKEAPKLLFKGGWIGAGILAGVLGIAYIGNKSYCFMKDRKEKIKNEPTLKKNFS